MNTKPFRTSVIASVVVLYASAIPAQAPESNTLYELKGTCISATMMNHVRCSRYIEGVIRGYLAAVAMLKEKKTPLAFFCAPNAETPDIDQSMAYIRKYINRDSRNDQRDAELVIFEALREEYGCKP